MRRIAVINQKGGVGKTTTAINLSAALTRLGRRVVVVDMDPQANLSLHVDRVADSGEPSVYRVLTGSCTFTEAIRTTDTPGLSVVPSNIDLSGAETELASAMGRETILGEAIDEWVEKEKKSTGRSPAEYLILDCPPSLGLLALNALATADEVLLTVQTEFLALQGMSKLVEIVQLVRKRLNAKLKITGILPCMYDTRLRLAREVLAEIRQYFPGQVFKQPIGTNVKLAEAPSFGQTIFQYAEDSKGAADYLAAAHELIAQEGRDPELAALAEQAQAKPEPESELRDEVITPKAPPKTPAKSPAKSTPKPKPAPAKSAPEPVETPEEPAATQAEPAPAPPAVPQPETPDPPPARSPEPPPSAPPTTAAHSEILRAEALPPLPRDAFENYLDSMQGY